MDECLIRAGLTGLLGIICGGYWVWIFMDAATKARQAEIEQEVKQILSESLLENK